MSAERKTIRWSVHSAAQEFPIDRQTLDKNLRASDIAPGKDGKFSTQQICRAVFGDMDGAKLQLLLAQGEKTRLEVRARKGELIEREKVIEFNDRVAVNVRQRIMASGLTREEQNEILSDLEALGESKWAKELSEPCDA